MKQLCAAIACTLCMACAAPAPRGRAGAGVGATDSLPLWLKMPSTEVLLAPALLPFRQWRAVKRTEAQALDTLTNREWRSLYRAERGAAKLSLKARQTAAKEAERVAKLNLRVARKLGPGGQPGWFAGALASPWSWLLLLALAAAGLVARMLLT